MVAVAPETAGPPARAEATTERRTRWRRKIPTSILLTLAGIALSAWLLPAFTRQWDDRQKARSLKAVLVTDMAAATARALTDADALTEAAARFEQAHKGKPPPPPPAVRDVARISKNWTRARIEIEARLRPYFPMRIVRKWQLFAYAMDLTLVRGISATVIIAGGIVNEERVHRAEPAFYPAWVDVIHTAWSLDVFLGQPVDFNVEFYRLEIKVLSLENAVADALLAAHPEGYSTRTRDLIHDLLPF
jgi:hypothetical protein